MLETILETEFWKLLDDAKGGFILVKKAVDFELHLAKKEFLELKEFLLQLKIPDFKSVRPTRDYTVHGPIGWNLNFYHDSDRAQFVRAIDGKATELMTVSHEEITDLEEWIYNVKVE